MGKPYFPFFIDLTGKRCVVVGGGAVAARKVRILLDFSAAVTVLDPAPSEAIRALSPPVILQEQGYADPEALTGAALVIAASNKRELNRQVAEDAQKQKIPVNAADDPEVCTFFFPAIVRRGELVAGISTSGACPRLAARLREHLETLWSPDLEETLELLKTERQRLRSCTNIQETIRQLDLLIDKAADT